MALQFNSGKTATGEPPLVEHIEAEHNAVNKQINAEDKRQLSRYV